MHFTSLLASLSVAALAVAAPSLDVQARASACKTPKGSGSCMSTSSCSGAKESVPGYCPGPTDIQCCVKAEAAPAPSSGGSKGEAIVTAAKKEEGLPYVWGGGGCKGPSGGGFDCSGLTQYGVCQAVGTTIPRTAQTQYHASSGKHIPRSQAEAGDLVFWGKNGDCTSAVDHVAIWMGSMRSGYILNAAHTGVPVREQTMWTSYGGLEVCPDAVRFW